MKKTTQAYLMGFILGSIASIGALAFLFFSTTVSYKSSLFPHKNIVLTTHHFKR